MDTSHHPKVGVGVFVWRDERVITCRRLGSHGHQAWQVPGGHLEFGESFEECAAREVMEEVGVAITNIRFITATNDIFEADNKHYITIWMEADWAANEPTSCEPDKIAEVGWRKPNELPLPHFEPCWGNLRHAKPELFD